MRSTRWLFAAPPGALALIVALAAPVAGQQQPQQPATLVGDLMRDVGELETKFVGLVKEIPAEKWAWRPSEGTRSVLEVVKHVAADNYLLPVVVGVAAPAETGITSDYNTAVAYEKREMDRAAALATVQASFAHLKKALGGMTDAKLTEPANVFGTQSTARNLWLLTVTHLHEHLGQMIAYARSNDVVPPWSR